MNLEDKMNMKIAKTVLFEYNVFWKTNANELSWSGGEKDL